MKKLIRLFASAACVALTTLVTCIPALAQDSLFEDRLGAGDIIRVHVYQSPDLTQETRILETGHISYPLIGATKVAGLTIPEAEALIAKSLKAGGFIQQPQVTIAQLQIRRKTVTVLGAVGRAGLYPLDALNTRLSNILAAAGGIASGGSDVVILTGKRDGKPMRQEIDVAATYLDDKIANDVVLASGDTIYVHRAPSFYVYGEAGKPGPYRLERNMTVMQALVTAGGPTQRGTERNLRLNRRQADGSVKESRPELTDLVQSDDVIFVRESLF
ncbi:MAG: polysaccharide export protein EpsE [Pseudomonadota bacterium]